MDNQIPLINELDNYEKFLVLRRRLGIPDKALAVDLGISSRALTERVTGRAGIKNETILAMQFLLNKKQGA